MNREINFEGNLRADVGPFSVNISSRRLAASDVASLAYFEAERDKLLDKLNVLNEKIRKLKGG